MTGGEANIAALTGKTILVTGAASGIGYATAQRIVNLGGRCVAVDRSDKVNDLSQLPGIIPVVGDVSDSQVLAHAVHVSEQEFGHLDGAVAAAGVTRAGSVETMELSTWDEVMRVNLTAVFLLAQAVFPAFRAAKGGSFVAIASQVGLVGYPNNVAYCAAKAGVINLVRAMAVDASADGIRSNAVCPGPVDTPMLREGFAQSGEDIGVATARVPAGRIATASEIAATTCFLLSNDSQFVTGAAWAVDGGYTAQ